MKKKLGSKMKKQFLEIGKIVTTHGIAGEVRAQAWCDSNEFMTQFEELYFDQGKTKIKIEHARVHKNVVILKIQGVHDMNTAQTLRNKILYLNRDDVQLEDGAYFIQDLIGMDVLDYNDPSIVYGQVQEITETGANDVYHIKTLDDRIVLIPAIPDVIRAVDSDQNQILITPLKGLFDDED